jgi:hypothetical protein
MNEYIVALYAGMLDAKHSFSLIRKIAPDVVCEYLADSSCGWYHITDWLIRKIKE